jgi:hypothetical protein
VEGKGKPKNGVILQVVLFPFHELELVPWALEWTPAALKEDKGATKKVYAHSSDDSGQNTQSGGNRRRGEGSGRGGYDDK